MVTLREKVAAPSRFDPGNTIGRNPSLDQRSCTIAPEIEIIRCRQMHHMETACARGLEHGHAENSSSCSVLGASIVRRSARSVSIKGRQSTVQMNGRTLVMDNVSRATSSSRRLR